MADEKLSPERAVRLLRAKAAELENWTKDLLTNPPPNRAVNDVGFLAADIALVAGLLADHIERSERHDEQLRQMYGFAVDHDVKLQGYLASILEVTEFDVGSYEEANYVAQLKAECDAYLGRRLRKPDRKMTNDEVDEAARRRAQPWGPDHPDYDEMGQ